MACIVNNTAYLIRTRVITSLAAQLLQCRAYRGNGIVSLIFFSPSKICRYLSKPMPKPPVVQPPYLRRSKYHARFSGMDFFNRSMLSSRTLPPANSPTTGINRSTPSTLDLKTKREHISICASTVWLMPLMSHFIYFLNIYQIGVVSALSHIKWLRFFWPIDDEHWRI